MKWVVSSSIMHVLTYCVLVTGDPAKIKISIQDLTYIWGWTQKAQKYFNFYCGLYKLAGQRGQILASALHKVKK